MILKASWKLAERDCNSACFHVKKCSTFHSDAHFDQLSVVTSRRSQQSSHLCEWLASKKLSTEKQIKISMEVQMRLHKSYQCWAEALLEVVLIGEIFLFFSCFI